MSHSSICFCMYLQFKLFHPYSERLFCLLVAIYCKGLVKMVMGLIKAGNKHGLSAD